MMNWLQKLSQVIPPWIQTWEEFIAYHRTGYIQPYEEMDLNHYNATDYYNKDKYPILLDKQSINGIEVEFRQSGQPINYSKLGEPDEHGYSDFIRDEQGNLVNLHEQELTDKDLPKQDTTIYLFVGNYCVGHIGDSFGATELFIVREFQGHGIGSTALKLYMETYPSKSHKTPRLGQMTSMGVSTAQNVWIKFVEEAMARGENVPVSVQQSYSNLKQEKENIHKKQVSEIPDMSKYVPTISQKIRIENNQLDDLFPPDKGFNTSIIRQLGGNVLSVEHDQFGRARGFRVSREPVIRYRDVANLLNRLGYQPDDRNDYQFKTTVDYKVLPI